MIYPDDERINVSKSNHSIAVVRDVTTPGYSFPSEQLLKTQKSFLTAGMQGLHGCGFCGGLGDTESSPTLTTILGLVSLVVFLLPPRYKPW